MTTSPLSSDRGSTNQRHARAALHSSPRVGDSASLPEVDKQGGLMFPVNCARGSAPQPVRGCA